MKAVLVIFAFLFPCRLPATGGQTLTNVIDVTRSLTFGLRAHGTAFDLTGTVVDLTHQSADTYVLADGTGSVRIDHTLEYPSPSSTLSCGDRLRVRGVLGTNGLGRIVAIGVSQDFLAHVAPPPATIPATAAQILDHRVDERRVRLRGFVQDARIDETDPEHVFLMIRDGADTVFTAFQRKMFPTNDPSALIGAGIEVAGRVIPNASPKRRFITHEFAVETNVIQILQTPAERRARAPAVARLVGCPPSRFTQLGPHRAVGEVIAVYNRNHALLRTADGDLVTLEDCAPLPRFGQTVAAVGTPRTDLHFIHLCHAHCERLDGPPSRTADILPITSAELGLGLRKPGVDSLALHGRTVRLRGSVRLLPRRDLNEHLLLLDSGGRAVPVDLSSLEPTSLALAVGTTVELTAVCVLSIENWQPGLTYSRVLGFTLVPRNAADLKILSDPPWWTVRRLLVLVGVLLVALFGFFVWNRILRRLVERRGRELFRAELTAAKSELRVEERTRLAVELHDSLAQDLTGISMEIETAQRCRETDGDRAFRHIDSAGRSLKACRNELRNTLWDLRSQALEEADVNKAIRQTLLPHIGGVELKVRFNVPRSRLSDNALHEILRIIRELVVNAIRHGRADRIFIAGSLEPGRLMFSVRDNGGGFDPSAAPGADKGHYGLVGIRERLRRLGGTLELNSQPGKGAEARITVRLVTPQKASAS